MQVSEQMIFDYIKCPCFFDIKYNKKIEVIEPVTMPKLLNKIAIYFYLNLLDGRIASRAELKKKWDHICNQNRDFIDSRKNLDGYGSIMKFCDWAENNKILVADVNTPFSFVLLDAQETWEISGNIGTIFVQENNKFELTIADFSQKMPNQIDLNMLLKHTLDCYAFEKSCKKQFEGIKIHHIKSNKDFYTYRTFYDYERMKKAFINVMRCIKSNLIYPRETYKCGGCGARDYCKAWY